MRGYKIVDAIIQFKRTEIKSVTVLVEISKGDIRVITATSTPRAGYMFIMPGTVLSNELLQEVAATGCETGEYKLFPKFSKRVEEYNS
jgi:hypothetical protein